MSNREEYWTEASLKKRAETQAAKREARLAKLKTRYTELIKSGANPSETLDTLEKEFFLSRIRLFAILGPLGKLHIELDLPPVFSFNKKK